MTDMKRCTKCGFECPYNDAARYFNVDKSKRDKLRSWCRECQSKHNKGYRIEHLDDIKVKKKAYNETHVEERRIYHAAYNAEHKERLQLQRTAYYNSPEGKIAHKAAALRRRAKTRNMGGKLPTESIPLILKAHTDSKGRLRCAFCGKVIKGKYHLDHFIPVDGGGTNDPGNYRVMHPRCNLHKWANHPHTLGMLI